MKLFGVWEKEAAKASEAMARDPRMMAFGAAMMRSQLLAGRAAGLMLEAAFAPWQALVDGAKPGQP